MGLLAPEQPFVYAIGRIEARLPSLAIEKEFAQATERAETVSIADGQVLREMRSGRQSRFLVRHLCYVFTVQGIEMYIVLPRSDEDYEVLVESIGDAVEPGRLQVLIGTVGPSAHLAKCKSQSSIS